MTSHRKVTLSPLLLLFLIFGVKYSCSQSAYVPSVQVDVTSSDRALQLSTTKMLHAGLAQLDGVQVSDKPSDYLILVFIESTGQNDGIYALTSFIGRQADCTYRPRTANITQVPKLPCLAIDEFKTISIIRLDQLATEVKQIVGRFKKGVLAKDSLLFKPVSLD